MTSGEQSISAHINILKRKFERKIMHASDQGFPSRVNSTSVEGWREMGNFDAGLIYMLVET